VPSQTLLVCYPSDLLELETFPAFSGYTVKGNFHSFLEIFPPPWDAGPLVPLGDGANNKLYIKFTSGSIEQFDSSGSYLRPITASIGMCRNFLLDAAGHNLFVTGPFGDVLRINLQGTPSLPSLFVSNADFESGAVSMMRFGPDNDLYLLVQYGDSLEIVPNQQSIWRFDGMTGAPKGEVISKASPNTPNSLNFSADFDIGPDGTIYALKVFNQGILRFSGATGEFLDVFAPGSSVPDVYLIQFTPDRKLLYVAGSSDITEFDLTGTKTNYFKTSVTGIGGITFLPTSLPQGPTAPNRNIPINAIITIIIFGVRDDGPGVSYTPGRPPQSDPWPVWMYIAGLVWRDLQPDDRDVLIAFGIEQLGSLMSNQTSREAVQAAVKKGLSKPMLARLQRLIARHRRSVPLPA
jgi:hypothetical protein